MPSHIYHRRLSFKGNTERDAALRTEISFKVLDIFGAGMFDFRRREVGIQSA
jgi:hypothetical protein